MLQCKHYVILVDVVQKEEGLRKGHMKKENGWIHLKYHSMTKMELNGPKILVTPLMCWKVKLDTIKMRNKILLFGLQRQHSG